MSDDAVLRRWARRYRFDIGQRGYAGFALFVEPGPVFVVEHRGPGFQPFRHEYPARRDKMTFRGGQIEHWLWRVRRQQAFGRAVELISALRGRQP